MNWAETMKGIATVAVQADVSDDAKKLRRTQADSWDPFEVWLTRIKQPRDSVARSSSAGPSSGIADQCD